MRPGFVRRFISGGVFYGFEGQQGIVKTLASFSCKVIGSPGIGLYGFYARIIYVSAPLGVGKQGLAMPELEEHLHKGPVLQGVFGKAVEVALTAAV